MIVPHIRARAVKATKAFPFYFPVWQEGGQAHWQMTSYQSYAEEGYSQNSVIFSAIMYKVRAISQAPLRAYTGDERKPTLLSPTHPLALLVKRPNSFQSWMEFQQQNIVYLNLAGNVYVYIERESPRGAITGLYGLRPDRVKILIGENGKKVGYQYRPEGYDKDGLPILDQDMIHIKLPNPLDPMEGQGYGLSPIMPAARSGDVDNQVGKFLYGFFRHGIMGMGAFRFKGALNDPQIARLRAQFADIYGGGDKWHKPFVLDNEGEWQNITPTFDKMGFKDIDGRSESRLLGPLGVPGMLIGMRSGMDSSTFSNFEQADTVFWQNTMIPELRLFEEDYQHILNTDSAFVRFDTSRVPALQEDMTPVIDNYVKLWATGIDRRRAAELAGLPLEPGEGDEVSYLPAAVQPALMERTPPPQPIIALPAPQEEESEDESANKLFVKGLWFWRKQRDVAEDWEDEYEKGGRQVFDDQLAALLALIETAKHRALKDKASINWETVKEDALAYLNAQGENAWKDTFALLIKGLVTDLVGEWEVALGLQFNVQNLLALQWYDQYILKFAQEVNATTKSGISEVLQQAQYEGWSTSDTQKHLKQVFQQWTQGDVSAEELAWLQARMPDYRLEMIVRTETIRSYNAGTNALFTEWGVKEKQWWAALDERICPYCMKMHGRVIEVGGKFASLGETISGEGEQASQSMTVKFGDIQYPPLHVNCRCTLLPVI